MHRQADRVAGQARVDFVADNVEPGQACVHVQTCDTQSVVMVPNRAGLLVVVIYIGLLNPAGAFEVEARSEPELGVAIALPFGVAAVHVRHHGNTIGTDTVKVVTRQGEGPVKGFVHREQVLC